MRFLAKVELLVLAFVSTVVCMVVCDEAMAGPPSFTAGKPSGALTLVPTTGNCQNYNDQVSQHGAPLNGDHPGYCQFLGSAQIILNGLPFDQFWQAVSAGVLKINVNPPYQVKLSLHGPTRLCATATDLNIEVSMQIPTSRLDWTAGAASVGMACFSEWKRRSDRDILLLSDAGARTQQLVNSLNSGMPRVSKAAHPSRLGRPSRRSPRIWRRRSRTTCHRLSAPRLPGLRWECRATPSASFIATSVRADGRVRLTSGRNSSRAARLMAGKKIHFTLVENRRTQINSRRNGLLWVRPHTTIQIYFFSGIRGLMFRGDAIRPSKASVFKLTAKRTPLYSVR